MERLTIAVLRPSLLTRRSARRQNPLLLGYILCGDAVGGRQNPLALITRGAVIPGAMRPKATWQHGGLSGNAFGQPPVLKHGPRSASCMRVEGLEYPEA